MSIKININCHSSRGSNARLKLESEFDNDKKRHYINGKTSVLHCHHYISLFTQLANDAVDLGGLDLLAEASAETFGEILKTYYDKNGIIDTSDRIAIAEQYFRFLGLGHIIFEFNDRYGEATLNYSHIDEGWKRKWGEYSRPINYVGAGFIRAVWTSVFNNGPEQCRIEEVQGIVQGSVVSKFTIRW